MKKACICFLFVFALFSVTAHETVEQFVLKNGIPVYVRHMPENRINAVYFVVKGGTAYLPPELSGLESAVFSMMSRGSEKYSYSDIQSLEFDTHSSLASSSSRDGSVFGMTSIDTYFDRTFDCFADGFMHPTFAQKEYELFMTGVRQSVQSELNDPSSMLFYYSQKLIYASHPYQTASTITVDSIENITLPKIRSFHSKLLDSRRISVVACGNFSRSSLLEKLNATVGTVKAHDYELQKTEVAPVAVSGENAVFVHQAAAGTGFIMRAFASPAVSAPDYTAAQIAGDIYSDILFNVVRENYGACYTPWSAVLSSAAPFGFEYLYRASNLTDFSSYVAEARDIMKSGRVISGRDKNGQYMFEPLSERLEGYINSYINKKYASQATTGGIAARMCASLLQFGDIDSADRLSEIASRTTAEDILRVFRKCWIDGDSRWFAVVAPDDEEKIRF